MAKKTTPGAGKMVINTLVVKPNTRTALDVGMWRNALKAADRGKRERLYDLYEDILLDNVLASAIEKRIMAITNAELTFQVGEKTVEEMDSLIDTPEFETLLNEIMKARFWGKSVIELDFTEGLNAYSIPRKHLRPDLGLIVATPGDDFGIPYKGDDFFLDVGDDKDLGILLRVSPIAIYKRGGFGDWSQFVELFGMPQRIGKYNSHDDDARRTLEEALEKAGSASWLVIPKDTDVETKESTSFSNALMHEKFRTACNEEMLISVIGQTMTTMNGSSKSQSETHKDVEEGINKADRRFVQRLLNTQLLPRLAKRGYPVGDGFFFFPDEGESLTVEQRLNVHIRFKNELRLDIDDDYLYETYSVPKPKGGAKPKKEEKPKDEKPNEDKPKGDGEEQRFWERVFNFFVLAPSAKGAIQQNCHECGGNHHTANLALPKFDNPGLIGRVTKGQAPLFDPQLFAHTAKTLTDALAKGWAEGRLVKPGITYGWEPDALKTAMDMNVFRFSAGKNLAEVAELNRLFRESTSFNEFLKEAEKTTEVFNQTWLRTEYDTANLTAESTAAYHRLAEQTDIFPYWQYITINDGRVREEHAALHGLILPANDSRWSKIYPPNGWNCRCRIVPITGAEAESLGINVTASRAKVDRYFKTKEWAKNAKQGFDVNRALSGEVFTKNQQYVNNFRTKAIDTLRPTDWGLESLDVRLGRATDTLAEYAGTRADWFNANSQGGYINLSDYKGRTVRLSEAAYRRNTIGIKATNTKYLDALKDIAAKPDEVWLNNQNTFAFVRYYKGQAIGVRGEINGRKEYIITEWFRITERENPRAGLLIQGK